MESAPGIDVFVADACPVVAAADDGDIRRGVAADRHARVQFRGVRPGAGEKVRNEKQKKDGEPLDGGRREGQDKLDHGRPG